MWSKGLIYFLSHNILCVLSPTRPCLFQFLLWNLVKSQKHKQTTSFLASGEAKAVFVLKTKSWRRGAFPVFCEILSWGVLHGLYISWIQKPIHTVNFFIFFPKLDFLAPIRIDMHCLDISWGRLPNVLENVVLTPWRVKLVRNRTPLACHVPLLRWREETARGERRATQAMFFQRPRDAAAALPCVPCHRCRRTDFVQPNSGTDQQSSPNKQ